MRPLARAAIISAPPIQPRVKLTRTFLLLFLAPALASCRSYNEKMSVALTAYEAGDFSAAADRLTSEDLADERDSRRDGLLFRLEAAKALLDAGRYEESSAMFDRAAELIELGHRAAGDALAAFEG